MIDVFKKTGILNNLTSHWGELACATDIADQLLQNVLSKIENERYRAMCTTKLEEFILIAYQGICFNN